MPQIPQLRVMIESDPHDGRWNMAVDESLLNSAIELDVATLRWYRWCEPTVSLGYFQQKTELDADDLLSNLPVVRRITGGGAILHDNEWTYSVALPSSRRRFRDPEDLYRIVHRGLIDGLKQVGYPVRCRGETLKRIDEPLLCFLRQDAHDITLNGQKILGSAQRRRRGAILQHGSLIQHASIWAKQLPGLADLAGKEPPENLVEILSNHLVEALALARQSATLTDSEIAMARRICERDSVHSRER